MKPAIQSPRPGVASAQFRVGLASLPWLADHGFQDMVVLPGSFYVDAVLRMEREVAPRGAAAVAGVRFHNPVILSAQDVVLEAAAREREDGRVEYRFHEADAAGVPGQLVATLEVERSAKPSLRTVARAPDLAATTTEAAEFYAALRRNGNQYGPAFQRVLSLRRSGERCLARLSTARDAASPHCLHPSVLDAATQLIAPFMAEKGKTFILRGIDRIELADLDFPAALWGESVLLPPAAAGEWRGDIRLFDEAGRVYLEILGAAFALLDSVEAATGETPATSVVVAANFTAEPLEDSLAFWGRHFNAPLRTEFAPYNQVLQQLLDRQSALHRNRDGVNVALLSLEEWAAGGQNALAALGKEQAQRAFAGHATSVLPNGLEVAHLNQYETEYLYQEIFEDQAYLRHGIRLEDGDTVIDIGANIGMFSLFVMSRCANPTIYAFEPSPQVHALLQANCQAYGGGSVRALNLGVSDREKTATFTFYEKSSVFSGFQADEANDRAAIQAVVRNMLASEAVAGESVDEYVSELTADRLGRSTYECRLTSVSDLIRENHIERIGLLKIDAEKSELDIVAGIDEADWPKIDQIVVEIHDPTGQAVKRIESLLRTKGFRCALESEKLLENSGLFNLYATRRESVAQANPFARNLARNTAELAAALRSFMSEAKAPLILALCPRSPAAKANAQLSAALDEAEAALLAEAGQIANVHAIDADQALRRYPVADYYDAHSYQAGHVRYTPEAHAAIGTELVRAVTRLKRNPYKVVVLDCDNTLWKGVVGEDGWAGVELTPAHRALQEFMLRQKDAGMLLCLSSKNNEKDVLEVFERRTDMPLKREHLVAWRISWQSKSSGIRSLAHELNLGLDSFIFIDDNPVECADVRINCPGVLALQLPSDSAAVPAFLEHIWAFDHSAATEEDQKRTRMYRENKEREQYRGQALSLKDFLDGLQLRVHIAEAAEGDLGRVAQLTQRTNQFNFTTVRRTEGEIRAFVEDGRCLAVRVTDRFGDYGLVGVLMYRAEAERYVVDTLLLSCRVLGRGVEHELVSSLGRRAVADGKRCVDFSCVPTEKNQPALEFITRIGARHRNGADGSWTFPAQDLAAVVYDPATEGAGAGDEAADEKPVKAGRGASPFQPADLSGRLQRIGEEFSDARRLVRAIEEQRRGAQDAQAEPEAVAGDPLEAALAQIWRRVLAKPRIGLHDNFFDVGGTSLRAVQIVAMIRREMKQSVSIVSVFECPTVALLAARMSGKPAHSGGAPALAVAAVRGQQRRYDTMRRKSS